MTSKTIVAFEKWHNEFYGPQDRFNPVRSLDRCPEETGLGYEDSVTQAQFCAFEGTMKLAAPEAPRQEPVARWTNSTGDPYRLCPATGNLQIKISAYGDAERWRDVQMSPAQALTTLSPLYAAPLSPDHSGGGAGVVLPERMPMRPYQTVDKGSTNYKAGFNAAIKQAEELNACLDKVKELNQ